MRIKALRVVFFLKPLFYKAFRKAFFYSKGEKERNSKGEKERNREADFQLNKVDKYIYRIRGLSVFIGKNSKVLKRRKYKCFRVFLLYGMLATLLKYEENKAKRAKNLHFYKGLSEVWWRKFGSLLVTRRNTGRRISLA